MLRDGSKRASRRPRLVPGDVVLLQSGDKVPADLRLIRGRDLQIDESALTGESLPVDKRPEPVAHDTVLADRTNMAYASHAGHLRPGGRRGGRHRRRHRDRAASPS